MSGARRRSPLPALCDQVAAALEAGRPIGCEGLVADRRRYLDAFLAARRRPAPRSRRGTAASFRGK